MTDAVNGLFAVADGVGGYAGGKEASSIAVGLLEKNNVATIVDETTLSSAIIEIHDVILEKALRLNYPGMGTTISCAKILPGRRVLLANIGDSPILLFREGSVSPVYHDDSHRSKDPSLMYGIVQYLGADIDIVVHARTLSYSSGDILLLCSDGVTDNLSYSKLEKLIPLESAEKIVQAALEEGAKPDDMTAVMVFL